ncbi:MAG: hypothetical protein K0R97_661, partial [Oerskovia sp.]|nr:hypothetical protein [Oerskovia sp.]
LTLRDVISRALEGDPGCRRVVADAGDRIGIAVATLASAMNPQVIVVGGELAETGEILAGPLRDAVRRHLVPNTIAPVEVVLGELGARAEVMGALALALQSTDVTSDVRLAPGAPGPVGLVAAGDSGPPAQGDRP